MTRLLSLAAVAGLLLASSVPVTATVTDGTQGTGPIAQAQVGASWRPRIVLVEPGKDAVTYSSTFSFSNKEDCERALEHPRFAMQTVVFMAQLQSEHPDAEVKGPACSVDGDPA